MWCVTAELWPCMSALLQRPPARSERSLLVTEGVRATGQLLRRRLFERRLDDLSVARVDVSLSVEKTKNHARPRQASAAAPLRTGADMCKTGSAAGKRSGAKSDPVRRRRNHA